MVKLSYSVAASIALLIVLIPASYAGIVVEHTAWDIRKVAEVFHQHPKATRIHYRRDTETSSGEYSIRLKDGTVEKIEIPPRTSPVPYYVQTSYPKIYSRGEIERLMKELDYGDSKSLIKDAHETAGIVLSGKKIKYVIEFTGIEYAGKPAEQKIKILERK